MMSTSTSSGGGTKVRDESDYGNVQEVEDNSRLDGSVEDDGEQWLEKVKNQQIEGDERPCLINLGVGFSEGNNIQELDLENGKSMDGGLLDPSRSSSVRSVRKGTSSKFSQMNKGLGLTNSEVRTRRSSRLKSTCMKPSENYQVNNPSQNE